MFCLLKFSFPFQLKVLFLFASFSPLRWKTSRLLMIGGWKRHNNLDEKYCVGGDAEKENMVRTGETMQKWGKAHLGLRYIPGSLLHVGELGTPPLVIDSCISQDELLTRGKKWVLRLGLQQSNNLASHISLIALVCFRQMEKVTQMGREFTRPKFHPSPSLSAVGRAVWPWRSVQRPEIKWCAGVYLDKISAQRHSSLSLSW